MISTSNSEYAMFVATAATLPPVAARIGSTSSAAPRAAITSPPTNGFDPQAAAVDTERGPHEALLAHDHRTHEAQCRRNQVQGGVERLDRVRRRVAVANDGAGGKERDADDPDAPQQPDRGP